MPSLALEVQRGGIPGLPGATPLSVGLICSSEPVSSPSMLLLVYRTLGSMTRNASGRSSWHRWRSSSDVTPVACASELGFVVGTSDLLLRNDLLNSELSRTGVHR